MSFYVKISSYLTVLFIGFKLRTYLSNKFNEKTNIDQTVDKQMVLFFPETQIKAIDCFQYNFNVLLSRHPMSELCQLLSVLKSSRQSLDICMFCLTFEPILQIIQELSQNGIYVRIITNGQKKPDSVSDEVPHQKFTQFEPLVQLFRFGVEIKFLSLSSEGLMHNKFTIIDNKLLINGSLNWAENSIFNSYNDCIVTTDPKLVLTYLKQFNDIWNLNSF